MSTPPGSVYSGSAGVNAGVTAGVTAGVIATRAHEVRNHALDRLKLGHPVLVATVRDARSGDIARMLKACDYDVLVIDLEHMSLPGDAVHEIAMTALDVGITPLIRLPDHAPGPISRALSHAALGIVAPHVGNADEARMIVNAARFAPDGERAVPPMFPHFGYRTITQAGAIAQLAAATMVVALIETAEGLDNADEIAAVPGIDVLFLGTSDLAQAMGIAGQKDHPVIGAATARIVGACRHHGKIPGIGGITETVQFERALAAGMLYLSAGSDTSFLLAGAREQARTLRALVP
ncbi:MAG: aldolase [Proteobacteria bacterium]|nr:aldolase [Burkholderiales bacterium]